MEIPKEKVSQEATSKKVLYENVKTSWVTGMQTLENTWFCQSVGYVLHQGSSNLTLEVQSAAEFSSNPDQTRLPVIF